MSSLSRRWSCSRSKWSYATNHQPVSSISRADEVQISFLINFYGLCEHYSFPHLSKKKRSILHGEAGMRQAMSSVMWRRASAKYDYAQVHVSRAQKVEEMTHRNNRRFQLNGSESTMDVYLLARWEDSNVVTIGHLLYTLVTRSIPMSPSYVREEFVSLKNGVGSYVPTQLYEQRRRSVLKHMYETLPSEVTGPSMIRKERLLVTEQLSPSGPVPTVYMPNVSCSSHTHVSHGQTELSLVYIPPPQNSTTFSNILLCCITISNWVTSWPMFLAICSKITRWEHIGQKLDLNKNLKLRDRRLIRKDYASFDAYNKVWEKTL